MPARDLVPIGNPGPSVARCELGLAELAVEVVAAVALVDDDQVVGVDRQDVLVAVEHPPHQALDGGDLQSGVGLGLEVAELLDVVAVGEGLVGLELDVLEGFAGVLAEGATVDDEQRPAEAVGLDQPVEQADAGARLAGAGGHRHQDLAASAGDRSLDGAHRLVLVVAQRQVVGRRGFELGVRGLGVDAQQLGETGGTVPAFEGAGMVRRAAGVEEPDAALDLQLAQVRPAVGGEQEGDEVALPRSARRFEGRGDVEAAAVALGLLDRSGDVLPGALGLHHRQRRQAAEQDVVRRTVGGGPLGDGQVASFPGTGAEAVAELVAVGVPAGVAQLQVDQLAGLGLVEGHRRGGFVRALVEFAALRRGLRLAVGTDGGQAAQVFGGLRLGLGGEGQGRVGVAAGGFGVGLGEAPGFVGEEGALLRRGGAPAFFVEPRGELGDPRTQRGGGIDRRLRGHERPRRERAVDDQLVVPDAQRAGRSESLDGVPGVAGDLVAGLVAESADDLERLDDAAVVDARGQLADQLGQGLAGVEGEARGAALGEALDELAQLDQRRVGVAVAVELGELRQLGEPAVVGGEEAEVARRPAAPCRLAHSRPVRGSHNAEIIPRDGLRRRSVPSCHRAARARGFYARSRRRILGSAAAARSSANAAQPAGVSAGTSIAG
jgi:hypothetical protein